MTKILTTVALLAAIATPAFAQNASNAYASAQSQGKYSASLNGGGSSGYNQSEAQSVLNR